MVHEFWREKHILHINVKELHAAVNTVMALAKKNDKVLLSVDNSVVYWYLQKGGGRIPSLNDVVRPFLKWCMEQKVQLMVQQVKSDQVLAEKPSRWGTDHGDFFNICVI